MADRHFHHSYFEDGVLVKTWGKTVLSTYDIAQAAMREIIQLELSASPFDIFMTGLLDPSTDWFTWVEQLGQVRETRTALSGLFGRFVARAYLTRYEDFQHFEPIRGDLAALGAWPGLWLKRNEAGDLPDWIVSQGVETGAVAVAEAKGSHNSAGPKAALDQARKQAKRVDVMAGADALDVKRFSIATRWAVAGDPKLSLPYLWVDDPIDGERAATAEESLALQRSVGLGHFAAFARGMGLPKTAKLITDGKAQAPGHLMLDASELVAVEDDLGARAMMVAAVTPSGVVSLPDDVGEDFQSALSSVFGDNVLLMVVDAASIYAIDALVLGEDAQTKILTSTRLVDQDPGQAVGRRSVDGVEVVPLKAVRLRGRGIPIDLGPQLI
jgi:hypothetical protein